MSVQSARSEDMLWVHEHVADFAQYSDNWIAVIDKRIVASGYDLRAVLDDVLAQGLDEPFVYKVPRDVRRKTYFIG